MTDDFQVLALDPGQTTGYALLDPNGQIVRLGELRMEQLEQIAPLGKTKNLEVVLELVATPTLSALDRGLAVVVAYLRQIFPKHIEVYPSWWKQTPVAHHHVPTEWDGQAVSAHMKDAVRIGIYYLTILRQRECKRAESTSPK